MNISESFVQNVKYNSARDVYTGDVTFIVKVESQESSFREIVLRVEAAVDMATEKVHTTLLRTALEELQRKQNSCA